jgi:hypothetical protein
MSVQVAAENYALASFTSLKRQVSVLGYLVALSVLVLLVYIYIYVYIIWS